MRRNRWGRPSSRCLVTETKVRVRFQEVDALRVVWHGHYLTYFELGRTAFGRDYEFGYEHILEAGYIAPLVHAEADYLAPARYGEELTIRARLHEDEGARIPFTYLVTNAEGRELATGFTVQVFTDQVGEIVLTKPAFYEQFLERCAARVVTE